MSDRESENRRLHARYLAASISALDEMEAEDDTLEADADEVPDDIERLVMDAVRKEVRMESSGRMRHFGRRRRYFIAVAVCIVLLGASFCVNADMIHRIFFIKQNEHYMDVEWTDKFSRAAEVKETLTGSGWSNFYYPKYLPEGYELFAEECKITKDHKQLSFTNGDNILSLIQLSSDADDWKIDDEVKVYEKTFVGENPAILMVENDARSTIAWVYGNIGFTISGHMNQDELRRIAESLTFIQ